MSLLLWACLVLAKPLSHAVSRSDWTFNSLKPTITFGRQSKGHETGIPLNDEMRLPWLHALCKAAETARRHGHVVLACSALKQQYRDLFRTHVGHLRFIFLDAGRDAIAQRMASRRGHFMPASLLDTQFATLERPLQNEGVIAINAAAPMPTVEDAVEAAATSVLS